MPPRKKTTPSNPSQAEHDRLQHAVDERDETRVELKKVNKQHLELITEIRALNMQVRTLHNIFVKRTVLWWVIGIETAIAGACIIGLFVFAAINHGDTNRLINRFEGSCKVRNVQINGTKRFITDTQRLQAEAAGINAKLLSQLNLQLSPEDAKKLAHIQTEYDKVLKRYHDSQPPPLKCDIGNN